MEAKIERIRESLKSGGKFELTTYENGRNSVDAVTLEYLIRGVASGSISDRANVMFGPNQYCTIEQLLRESTNLENEKAAAAQKAAKP